MFCANCQSMGESQGKGGHLPFGQKMVCTKIKPVFMVFSKPLIGIRYTDPADASQTTYTTQKLHQGQQK